MRPSPSSFSRPTALIFALAFAFILTSAFAPDVSAQQRHRQYRHDETRTHRQVVYEQLDVRLTEINAKVRHGVLRATYEIDRKSWRRLKWAHITPRLNLYVPTRHGQEFKFSHAIELTERSGTVVFPTSATPQRGREAEFRLSGRRGSTRIGTTSYGASCGDRLRVAVHRRQQQKGHHGRGYADNSAVIQACSENTSWSGDFKKCVTKASAIRGDAVSTINACNAATSWSGDFNSCLDLSANLGRNKSRTIRACSAATSWSGDFKDCLRSSGAYDADAAPVVNACSSATNWSGDFKACMTGARHHGPYASRIVAACSNSTSWSGEFKDCLEVSRL